MTDQEAEKVAAVIATVDGGCYVCALKAAEELARQLPRGHDWRLLVRKAGGWEGYSFDD